MGAKIPAFLFTLALNAAAGFVIFFMMLVAMNGFSGSDAEWGMGAYIILAVIVSMLMSVGAVMVVQVLVKKQYSGISAALIAIPVFSILGAGLKIVCSLLGVGIADSVRVNH